MSEKKYEAVVWNDVLGSATVGMISGRPDCFDTIEDNLTLAEAVEIGAKQQTGNCAVREMGSYECILRGPGELNFANNIAKKTGFNNEVLINKFNHIYYGEMAGEYWDYA